MYVVAYKTCACLYVININICVYQHFSLEVNYHFLVVSEFFYFLNVWTLDAELSTIAFQNQFCSMWFMSPFWMLPGPWRWVRRGLERIYIMRVIRSLSHFSLSVKPSEGDFREPSEKFDKCHQSLGATGNITASHL